MFGSSRVARQLRGEFVAHRPFVQYVAVFSVLTVLAAVAANLTYRHPDRYPVLLALSLLWLIIAVVSALTSNLFFHINGAWFGPFGWERDGKIYQRLGVKRLQWLLLNTPVGWLNPSLRLKAGRRDLERLLQEMNPAEGTHALAGIITLALAGRYTWVGYPAVGAWLCAFNVPLNAYPIMLQRYNRLRITRALQRSRRHMLCRPPEPINQLPPAAEKQP